MKCPKCASLNLTVVDSRPRDDRNAVRRRRECLDCKERFTTMETIYYGSTAKDTPRVVAKTPQPAKAKSAIKRNVSAMFKNESRRESRYYDAWGPDNDYLGKL